MSCPRKMDDVFITNDFRRPGEIHPVIQECIKASIPSQSLVLDIGFGSGRIGLQILSLIDPKQLIGIECKSEEYVYGKFGSDAYFEKPGTISLFKYLHYKYWAEHFDKTPYDQTTFNNIVFVNYSTEFSSFTENLDYGFDFIILYDILHYTSMDDPSMVLQEVFRLLNKDGFFLISIKDSNPNVDKRQIVDWEAIIKVLGRCCVALTLVRDESNLSSVLFGKKFYEE